MATHGRLYRKVADLTVEIESYDLPGLVLPTDAFKRLTTIVELHGAGETGMGEDVNYSADEHPPFQNRDRVLPLVGRFSFAEYSELLDTIDLFAEPPEFAASRLYRRWAFESAALDLALRQAKTSLAESLELPLRPVTFVNSMGLGHPPDVQRVTERLEAYPDLRFKLDPASDWSEELCRNLAATGAIDILDLKGAYHGTPVDQPPDPVLYSRVATLFDGVRIEDPAFTDETRRILADDEARIAWDAPIHSVADIRALPFPPKHLNIKPSRSGTVRQLFAIYEHCQEHGVAMYGGGQYELGVGRGQIQYLAALFHPDGPNDVAPGEYNAPGVRPGLPQSPLPPRAAPIGFRWDRD